MSVGKEEDTDFGRHGDSDDRAVEKDGDPVCRVGLRVYARVVGFGTCLRAGLQSKGYKYPFYNDHWLCVGKRGCNSKIQLTYDHN